MNVRIISLETYASHDQSSIIHPMIDLQLRFGSGLERSVCLMKQKNVIADKGAGQRDLRSRLLCSRRCKQFCETVSKVCEL